MSVHIVYHPFTIFFHLFLVILMNVCAQGRMEEHEPKDLTPMQDVGNHSGLGGMGGGSPETPGKKDRNSRKQCPYCNKGI